MWKTRIPYRLIDFSSRIHPADDFVIGIKRISDTGGAGSWTWIDRNDNSVDVEDGYFSRHPTYQFEEVNIGGNEMIAIPKFYVKSDTTGRIWISPTPREDEGFHVHPAFMSKDQEMSETYTDANGVVHDETKIMIGKWPSWIDYYHILGEKRRLWSIPSFTEDQIDAIEQEKIAKAKAENPNVDEDSVKFSEAERIALRTIYPSVEATYWENWYAADSWNDHSDDGLVLVNGFHMMNVWEWSAIQLLALIESKSPDAQLHYGEGNSIGTRLDAVDGDRNMSSNFHGIIGLWGNVWQWIQGVQTYYNGHIYVWDNIGNEVWKDTKKAIPMRQKENEVWSQGETCGYWRDRIFASGYNYDTLDMFLPDGNSFTSDYYKGSWSDGVWGRTLSQSKDLYACAVGGPYNSGSWCGLFGWNFNVRLGNKTVKNGFIEEEIRYAYPDVAARLCFSPVNLAPQGEDNSNG